MIIWFASGNIHKKAELAGILSDVVRKSAADGTGADIEIKIPRDAGLDFDPEESGNSFFENALIKAGALYRLLEEKRPPLYTGGDPIIADDSGICVDALGGRPGIHSARYCGKNSESARKPGDGAAELVPPGKKIGDTERNLLLLDELGANPRRGARFVCAMVLYYSPDRFLAVQETMKGELVKDADAVRGKGGFGYDPILYIPELGRTVAELSGEEKNFYSHRGKAGKIIGRIISGLTE